MPRKSGATPRIVIMPMCESSTPHLKLCTVVTKDNCPMTSSRLVCRWIARCSTERAVCLRECRDENNMVTQISVIKKSATCKARAANRMKV
eukprot:CAMPEP_0170443840 /NCGR_PEP_ID=MMETSP0117_2-20130122/48196_1 /TAXON_ID=400756 /ORGANISM="Durinskia baltica, Strain CSIRO CS-38" /LENGTH=90 /DNA_ID=CAMNT_0010704583 /DNA_START=125 /DNA_END=397 /DNA_ORIENTATION=+